MRIVKYELIELSVLQNTSTGELDKWAVYNYLSSLNPYDNPIYEGRHKFEVFIPMWLYDYCKETTLYDGDRNSTILKSLRPSLHVYGTTFEDNEILIIDLYVRSGSACCKELYRMDRMRLIEIKCSSQECL